MKKVAAKSKQIGIVGGNKTEVRGYVVGMSESGWSESRNNCVWRHRRGQKPEGVSWNGIVRVGGVEESIILGRNEKDTTRDSSNTWSIRQILWEKRVGKRPDRVGMVWKQEDQSRWRNEKVKVGEKQDWGKLENGWNWWKSRNVSRNKKRKKRHKRGLSMKEKQMRMNKNIQI